MPLREHLRLVLAAFAGSKLRVFLTLLGIVIGSGSLVFLAGTIVAAEDALMNASQEATEADLIRITGAPPPPEDAERATRPLSERDAEALSDSSLLRPGKVGSVKMKPDLAIHRGREKDVTVVGVRSRDFDLFRIRLEAGRLFSPNDQRARRRVAIVGHEVWTDLLESAPLEGQTLLLGDEPFTVVGVLAHKPSLGAAAGTWLWDRRVLIPIETFAALHPPAEDEGEDILYVRLAGVGPLAPRIRQVAAVVESILLRRHLGVRNFEVETESSSASQQQLVLKVVELLLFATGLVTLFVGGINIMNIMLVSVRERTVEIGVRRALGATRRAVLGQFLLESMALSLVGGVGGVLGALLMTQLSSLVLREAFGAWPFIVVPWSVVLAVTMAVLTGAIFGVFPAWRAAQLDPVEALRAE